MEEKELQPQSPLTTASPILVPTNVPLLYTNLVRVGITISDMQLTLTVNGNPFTQVILPLSSAKSLSIAISKAIKEHERKTKTRVLELDQLTELINKK